MKTQDKELLLKDLCARLPYGVECEIRQREGGSPVLYDKFTCGAIKWIQDYGWCVKPYLRPMESMTEEEIRIEREIQQDCFFGRKPLIILTDFYYSRNLDVNGLIEKGLALPAPDGMYNFK